MKVLQVLPITVLGLLVLAMLIGVSLVTLDKMKEGGSKLATASNESFTTNNVSISLSNGNITTFTGIRNASDVSLDGANYEVFTSNGTVAFNLKENITCPDSGTCYAFYTWRDYDTASNSAMNGFISAFAAIPNSWFSLIVTIIILGVVMLIVIYSLLPGLTRNTR